jgi:hypothetical protein
MKSEQRGGSGSISLTPTGRRIATTTNQSEGRDHNGSRFPPPVSSAVGPSAVLESLPARVGTDSLAELALKMTINRGVYRVRFVQGFEHPQWPRNCMACA